MIHHARSINDPLFHALRDFRNADELFSIDRRPDIQGIRMRSRARIEHMKIRDRIRENHQDYRELNQFLEDFSNIEITPATHKIERRRQRTKRRAFKAWKKTLLPKEDCYERQQKIKVYKKTSLMGWCENPETKRDFCNHKTCWRYTPLKFNPWSYSRPKTEKRNAFQLNTKPEHQSEADEIRVTVTILDD